MSQYDPMFDLKINVGHYDLYFMVQWFCHISWELFSGWTSYFGIMSQYDPTSHLKIFVGHFDLYFMVYWICLISWWLFDVWTLYFVIMSQCYAPFALKQCRSKWSIFSWSRDFALYLKGAFFPTVGKTLTRDKLQPDATLCKNLSVTAHKWAL